MAASADGGGGLYEALHLDVGASQAEIKSAYRRLSQTFHPDKHPDPSLKEAATTQFARINEAYQILSDPLMRSIYDEFGMEGVGAARQEMGSGSASASLSVAAVDAFRTRFRAAAEEATRDGGAGAARDAGIFATSNMIEVNLDATGLAAALDSLSYDPDDELQPSLLTFSRLGSVIQGTAYVTAKDAVTAQLTIVSTQRKLAGQNMGLVWHRTLSTHSFAEGTLLFAVRQGSAGLAGLSAKVSRKVSEYSSLMLEAGLGRGGFTTALHATRQLGNRVSGQLSWLAGEENPGVACTFRRAGGIDLGAQAKTQEEQGEDQSRWSVSGLYNQLVDPVAVTCDLRLTLGDTGARVAVKRGIGSGVERCGEDGGFVKASADVGTGGWDVETSTGRNFALKDITLGVGLGCGSSGVGVRLKVSQGQNRLVVPISFATEADGQLATIIGLSIATVVSATQLFVVRPLRKRWHAQRRQEERLKRADEMEAERRAAAEACDLMASGVERSIERENAVNGGGLLVERAVYGDAKTVQKTSRDVAIGEGQELELELIDVTDAVQYLVEDSKIHLHSTVKASLDGFWDPTALGEERLLKIWYQFRHAAHVCVVGDYEAVSLPVSTHRLS